MQRMGGIFPSLRVKGSHMPQRWRQCKKRCSCGFPLHPVGQPLRNISKAKATYRKEEKKKMHLTTSLSGGLDRSGAHFKAAFMAEIYTALRTSVPWLPRAKVCIYTWSTLSFFRAFGKKCDYWSLLNIKVVHFMCIPNASFTRKQ